VDDLPAAPLAALHATVDEPERPRLELLLEVPRLMEPEQLDAAGVVGERGRKHRPPAPPPHRDLARAADAAHQRHVAAGAGLADGDDDAPILVAKREVIEKVLDGRDSAPCQRLGPLGADAFHELDRVVELHRT